MTVPYTFANSTGFIPLSELDANFAAIPQYANTAGNIVGNIQSNITSLGVLNSLSVTGNVRGGYFIGNGAGLTNITVTQLPATALTGNTLSANVLYSSLTSVGILSTLSVAGNVFAANYTGNLFGSALYANTANSVSGANVVGNVGNSVYAYTAGVANAANLATAATTAGTVTTNAQPNITSVGTLTSLSAVGNITGNYFFGDGSQLTGLPATYGNANVAAYLPTYTGTLAGNNISVVGNVQGTYILGNGSQLTGIPNSTYSNANVSSFLPTYTGNISAGNISIGNLILTSTITATGNVLGGNINGANLRVTGVASVIGNISGNYLLGNGAYITGLPAGNYSNANVSAYLPTYTGNITANTISGTGNVNGSNFRTIGVVSAAGNITGNYFIGNGALLTGIVAGNYSNANVAAYLPINSANVTAGNILTDNYCYANGVPVSGLGANVSSSSVTYTAPFGGATAITGNSKWSQFVSVLDFGADPNGSVDSRGAFQAALNTGKHVYIPTGSYIISDRLLCTVPGQMVSGDGRAVSKLIIVNSFNLSATAVIDCSGLQEAPTFRDFGITFIQPDTSNRASLVAYPPAFNAQNAPRFTLQNMLIQGAINGIDLTGNSGGAFIDLLEMSAFGIGINIDGSADTIRIDKYHFWPFNLTANQQIIFYAAGTMALNVGRVDGLYLTEFLNISNLGLTMFQGGTGAPQVFIENSAFDSWNGINQSAGQLHVSNSYITIYPAANIVGYQMNGTCWAQFVNCWFLAGCTNQSMFNLNTATQGSLSLTQCKFEGVVSGVPYITAGTGFNAGCSLQVSDSVFTIGSTNSYVFNSSTPTSGTTNLHFNNNIVQTNPNVTFTNAIFKFASNNRIYMSGNRVFDKGTGTGTFIYIPQDNWNWVSGNMAPGWTITTPVGASGYYANNPH